MKPKNWIINQNCSLEEIRAIKNGATWFVERETEKAYLFVAGTKFGNIKMWCPKTQVEDNDSQEKQIADGLEYNMKLREVLNANGIKTSMNRKIKTATLIQNLKHAGIEVPAR